MKILIVDDNKDITDLFHKFLTLNDHDCVSVNEGHHAIDLILNEKFDKIILDLFMPVISGYDVLNTITEKGNIEFTNIIILTAVNISKEKKHDLHKLGITKILKKPISLSIIKDVIME